MCIPNPAWLLLSTFTKFIIVSKPTLHVVIIQQHIWGYMNTVYLHCLQWQDPWPLVVHTRVSTWLYFLSSSQYWQVGGLDLLCSGQYLTPAGRLALFKTLLYNLSATSTQSHPSLITVSLMLEQPWYTSLLLTSILSLVHTVVS